jgi:methyl-accepting chemotaxis protein
MKTKIATDEMIDTIVTETVIASVALTVIETRTGTGIEEVKDTMTMMTGITPGIRHLIHLAGIGIETGTGIVIAILIGGGGMIDEQSCRMRIFNGFGPDI